MWLGAAQPGNRVDPPVCTMSMYWPYCRCKQPQECGTQGCIRQRMPIIHASTSVSRMPLDVPERLDKAPVRFPQCVYVDVGVTWLGQKRAICPCTRRPSRTAPPCPVPAYATSPDDDPPGFTFLAATCSDQIALLIGSPARWRRVSCRMMATTGHPGTHIASSSESRAHFPT